jgi:hypothetical protein
MSFKRLFGGLSTLFLLVGAGLLCFTPGGLFNRIDYYATPDVLSGSGIYLGLPGPTLGLVFLLIGLTGFLILMCLRGSVTHARQRVRRFFVGFALLLLLVGAFLICLTPGGFFNRVHGYGGSGLVLDMPGPVVGFCFLGAGAVALIFAWSITPPRG